MRRAAALASMILGLLLIAIAASTYLQLRNLAIASPAVAASQNTDFRILTARMPDTSPSETSPSETKDAAAFVRQLSYRIYAIAVAGLAFLLIGVICFVFAQESQREPTGDLSSPATRLIAE